MTHPQKTKADLIQAITDLSRGYGATVTALVDAVEQSDPSSTLGRARVALAQRYIELAPLFVAVQSVAHEHIDETLLAWTVASSPHRYPPLAGELDALRERLELHANAVPNVANRGVA